MMELLLGIVIILQLFIFTDNRKALARDEILLKMVNTLNERLAKLEDLENLREY